METLIYLFYQVIDIDEFSLQVPTSVLLIVVPVLVKFSKTAVLFESFLHVPYLVASLELGQ